MQNRVVSNKEQEHTRQASISTSLDRVWLFEGKDGETYATPALVLLTFSHQLDDRVLQVYRNDQPLFEVIDVIETMQSTQWCFFSWPTCI